VLSGPFADLSKLARRLAGQIVVVVGLCAATSSANDLLIKNSAEIDRYDGQTGALIGFFSTALETPEGFCYNADGKFCVVGNALGMGHLEIEGVSGPPEFSPIYQIPHAITLGPDGRIYGTSNHFSGTGITGVVRFNGRTPEPFVTSDVTSAFDIRFGPDHNLYLTQDPGGTPSETTKVLRFNGTTGAFMGVFASGGGLTSAAGFTFGPDGDLFVASLTGNVLRFDGTSGAFEGTFVPAGSGGLTLAWDLEFGSDGKLYVLGRGGNVAGVRRYDGSTGAYLDTFVPQTAANGGTMIGFVVPEPSTTLLLAVGSLAFAMRRRPSYSPSNKVGSLTCLGSA